MSAEQLMRTVGVLASATTLSLLTTIAAYAAVSIGPLKWDGSFCTSTECSAALVLLPDAPASRVRVAQVAGKPS